MPTILTSSQQTFVDITDQRKLSAYITSNLPKTQSEDPNVLPHTYAPSWATTHLVLTPVIFLNQTSIALDATGLTILWKRKDGASAETALTTGETASAGILTVSQNKLAASGSGMITYICYISYYDSETKNTVNISADITYTLVKNAENARLAYVTSDTYVFKYNTEGTIVGATHVIINVSGDIGLMEANEAATFVQELAGDSANIIFGAMYDETVQDECTITVIATGLEDPQNVEEAPKQAAKPAQPSFSFNSNLANRQQAAPQQQAAQQPAFTPSTTYKAPEPSVKERQISIPDFLRR